MKISIIGNGFVGKATTSLECDDINVIIYDIDPDKCIPKNITLNEIVSESDIIFVCLPTPYSVETKKCYLGIIDSVLIDIEKINPKYLNKVVVRSTVPPNYCKKWKVAHMPEFLTEKNPIETFKNTNTWVIGNDSYDVNNIDELSKKINELLKLAYDNKCIVSHKTLFCSTNESALIKLGRNAFLATKVTFFNEMYDIANLYNADYENVRKGICEDLRIGHQHSMVPGHDGFRGFGGICFPKDLWNLIFSSSDLGYDPIMLKAVSEHNQLIRPYDANTIDIIDGRSIH